jgi:TIR domain-containing protein
MTDIFLSYARKDQERVRNFHRALSAHGFSVSWDQDIPIGATWETWIRHDLMRAKCVIAFLSACSAASSNVFHELAIAKEQNSLLLVLLDTLRASDFPLGLYSGQAMDMRSWTGDIHDRNWLELQRQLEYRLTPPWVRTGQAKLEHALHIERQNGGVLHQRTAALEAELDALRANKSSLEAKLESSCADRSLLEGQLQRAGEEHARLQRELGAIKQEAQASWASERVENALLRERINDVAAEVARLTAALEGRGSPIETILAEADKSGAGTQAAGSLAERIRALQKRAERIGAEQPPQREQPRPVRPWRGLPWR